MAQVAKEQKKGFKETEIGLVPEEWEVKRLKDLATVKYGKSKPRNSGNIPVVGSGGIYSFTSEPLVNFPTITIGRKGTAGKVWFLERSFWPSDTTFYLEWKEDNIYRFVYYCFLANPLSGEHAKTTLPSLQKQDLEKYLIPFPSAKERQVIIYLLSTIQEAVEATDRVITSAQDLKKSLKKHLFTYGPVPVDEAENVPLKETEIGWVPNHWEIMQLSEIAFVKGGKRLPKGHTFSQAITPYPYLRVVDFKKGAIEKRHLKYLTQQDHNKLKRYVISCNDVYISIAGTIGIIGTIPQDLDGAHLTENAAKIVIKDNSKIDNHYLTYYLSTSSGQEQIKSFSTKTTQPKLALSRIKLIKIPRPPQKEQKNINFIFETINKKIETEQRRKEALQTLFNSMLHHLMTGKVRVKDLEVTG